MHNVGLHRSISDRPAHPTLCVQCNVLSWMSCAGCDSAQVSMGRCKPATSLMDLWAELHPVQLVRYEYCTHEPRLASMLPRAPTLHISTCIHPQSYRSYCLGVFHFPQCSCCSGWTEIKELRFWIFWYFMLQFKNAYILLTFQFLHSCEWPGRPELG